MQISSTSGSGPIYPGDGGNPPQARKLLGDLKALTGFLHDLSPGDGMKNCQHCIKHIEEDLQSLMSHNRIGVSLKRWPMPCLRK